MGENFFFSKNEHHCLNVAFRGAGGLMIKHVTIVEWARLAHWARLMPWGTPSGPWPLKWNDPKVKRSNTAFQLACKTCNAANDFLLFVTRCAGISIISRMECVGVEGVERVLGCVTFAHLSGVLECWLSIMKLINLITLNAVKNMNVPNPKEFDTNRQMNNRMTLEER
jgi:hypothetical protein